MLVNNSFLECINVILFQDQSSKQNELLNSALLELTKQRVSILVVYMLNSYVITRVS